MPDRTLANKIPKLKTLSNRRISGTSINPAVELSGATPIYVQLVTVFRRMIESGEWPLEERIPVLEDLASEYGVARATVRQALGFLEQEGLIARFRGRGTFVTAKPKQEVWHDIPNNWEDIISSNKKLVAKFLDYGPAIRMPEPSHPAKHLADSYHYIRRLHSRGGVPYLIGSAYFDSKFAEGMSESEIKRSLILPKIIETKGFKVSQAHQTFTIGMAEPEVAHLLEIPLNSPILIVARSVFGPKDLLVYEAQGLYRGDFIRFTQQLV